MQMPRHLRHVALTMAAMAAIAPALGKADARSRLIIDPQTAFAMQIVAAHNRLRSAQAVRPTYWDHALAASADAYAAQLARTGRFAHSPQGGRPGQGENLWMGTRGAFSFDRMVADWGSEKRLFRAGQFPGVSTTGRWQDVGHYTQIIWPTSVRVGCAMRSSAARDYLVCRYGQSGNVFGERVGVISFASR